MKLTHTTYDQWLSALGDERYTLTLPNAAYSDHPHQPVPLDKRILDTHLLWLTVDQGFRGVVDDQAVELRPGTLSWFAPGTAHSFVIPQGVRTYRLRIHLAKGRRALTLPTPVLLAHNAWEARPLFEHILMELAEEQRFHDYRLRQLVGSLSVLAFRAQHNKETSLTLSQEQRLALQQCLAEHIHDGLTPSDLAKHLGYSSDYFSRIFKRTYGITARSWLVQERLRLSATLLLESLLPISEIAYECGFHDVNLFSRQFRHVYGCSPGQFRRRE